MLGLLGNLSQNKKNKKGGQASRENSSVYKAPCLAWLKMSKLVSSGQPHESLQVPAPWEGPATLKRLTQIPKRWGS